ncbi:hypothetical protein BUALT_Bualt01G0041900 [Buddleja alternifolia]|uniref:Uncharacterized protein n=1 Tax=Buddleja alternifolia TaxID=168488 RepID=A0AAV6Y4F1_9LAMI|nr:hypothetical protein BUALT_Bualt01G0041900 [Buddleja alternifolia]
MAYAAVDSLVQRIDQIRNDHEILFDKQQIECLLVKVSFLQTFLEEFSQKSSNEVKDMEMQIRDAAYAAEDLICSYISNELLSMCECCVYRNYTTFCQDLQKVVEIFDSMEFKTIELREMDSKNPKLRSSLAVGSLRPASGGKNAMVGFVDEILQIKDRLTGPPSHKLDVVSIVGMGGTGKTTLARNVYDDAFIVYHFYIRAWITVSQEYDERGILLGLLGSMRKLTEKEREDSNEDLAEYLYKSLKGRRYLIVMDDMWDVGIWDEMRLLFPNDRNGSRIMLTTRITDVALYASSGNAPYHVRFLQKDESWDLLQKKVFKDDCCPPELEEVGSEIAQSCGGLPLAIILVGGILNKVRRSRDHWRDVAKNIKSIVATQNDQCLEILYLSYNHLPRHLQMCFLYMGVFPEDYQIPVSKLIWLWAAEGFLKPCTNESLEYVGEKYLKDLIDRSLVLVGDRKSSGKIKRCNMHDLVRDLCVREAQKQKLFSAMKCRDDLSIEGTLGRLRLSFHSNVLYCNPKSRKDSLVSVREHSDGHLKGIYDSFRSSPLIRSLIFTGTYSNPMNIYIGFRLLRVLDADHLTFPLFPIEVVQLVNLIYLAFTFNGELPASLSNLQNLEILIVNQVFWGLLSYLPSEVWRMPRLRLLKFVNVFLPDALFYKKKTLCLENLQTLLGIRDFRVTEDVVEIIPNVKKLGIIYDKNSSINEWSFYCLHNLVYLNQLETLKCHFITTSLHSNSRKRDLPNLTFPSKLKRLTLRGWRIPTRYMSILGSLQSLEILKLQLCAFEGPEWELLEEKFCRLKLLLLEQMNLVQWRAETDNFPNLEHLIIKYCDELEEIPYSFGDTPTLQSIKLLNCSSSCIASARQIQENQLDLGNDGLEVIIQYENKPTLLSGFTYGR